MGRIPQTETDRRRSILWAAVAKLAGDRVQKTHLSQDSQTRVAVQLVGTVGRARIEDAAEGVLIVGTTGSRSKPEAARPAEIVALLLAELPEERRAQLLEQAAKSFAKSGKLPATDPGLVETAEAWLGRLKRSTLIDTAAPVSFQTTG